MTEIGCPWSANSLEAMAGPTVTPAFTASLRIFEAAYELKAVGEQSRDFLDTTKCLNDSMQGVYALRRQKTAGLHTNQKAWVDDQIRNTEKALSDAAALIEPARVELQSKSNRTKDTSLMSRMTFIIKDSSKVAMHQTQMTLAYNGLNAAVRVLYDREGHSSSAILQSGVVTHTPNGTSSPSKKSPPTYELSEFMNRRRKVSGDKQREGLRQTMLLLNTGRMELASAAPPGDHGRPHLHSQGIWKDSEQVLNNSYFVELEGETEFVKPIQGKPELDTGGVRYLDGLQSDSTPACTPIIAHGDAALLIGYDKNLSMDFHEASSIDSWTQGTLEAMERQRNLSSPSLTPQNSSVSVASPISPPAELNHMPSNDGITNMPMLDSPYYNPQPHHTRVPSRQATLPPLVSQEHGPDIPDTLHAGGPAVPARSCSYQTPAHEKFYVHSTKQTPPQEQRIFPLPASSSPPPSFNHSSDNVVDRTPRKSSDRSSKSFTAVELPGGVEISPTKAWPDAVELPAAVLDTITVPPSRPSHTVRDKFPFLTQSPDETPQPQSSSPPPASTIAPVIPALVPSPGPTQSRPATHDLPTPIQRRTSKLSKLQKPPRPSKPSHLQPQPAVSPHTGSPTAQVSSSPATGPAETPSAPVSTPSPSRSPPVAQHCPYIYQSLSSNDLQPPATVSQCSSTPATGAPAVPPASVSSPPQSRSRPLSHDAPELSQKQLSSYLQPPAALLPRSSSPNSRHTVPLVTQPAKVLPAPQTRPAPYNFPALTQFPMEPTHRPQTSSPPSLQPPISLTPGRSSPISHRSSSPAALSQPSHRSSSPAIFSAPPNPAPMDHSPLPMSPSPAPPELAQQLQQPNYPFYKPSSPSLAPQELHSQTHPLYNPASPSLKQTEIQDRNAPFYKELPATPLDYTRIQPPLLHTLDHNRNESMSSINLPSEPWHTSTGRQSRGRRWLEHHAEKAAMS